MVTGAAQADDYPKHMMKKIHHNRNKVWHFQDLLGHDRAKYHNWAENHCGNKGCRFAVLELWRHKHRVWHRRWVRAGRPHTPPVSYYSSKFAGLRCIHQYEGAWNANTGNGYYGGLQMDSSFESAYGPEFVRRYGHANNWPALDQLIAGYRAVQSRGYSPWPNTRIPCGV